jgi:hypothetical protein
MKLHVLDCGAMSCDLTWLLLKPGRTIRPRSERDKPIEWYPCTTHAVLVETDEGTLLWDTSCPRDWEIRWVPTGLQEFFPTTKSPRNSTSTPNSAGSAVIFGHDAAQLRSLRTAPTGFYK